MPALAQWAEAMDGGHPTRAGALALVGSGEFTEPMAEVDRWLLTTVGGPAGARVVVLPTASALEPGQPERWAALGVAHFRALGAAVEPVMLLTRADAAEAALVDRLRAADLYYVSGGDPEHLTETLEGTPAWAAIREAHERGAVLAGCSAGAMMLAGRCLAVRALMAGQPPAWRPALGLVPGVAVLPHFDTAAAAVGEAVVQAVLAAVPPGLTILGIDEETALVREPAAAGDHPAGWRVMGHHTVTVIDGDRVQRVYRAGDLLDLARSKP